MDIYEHALETWENEGGFVPPFADEGTRPPHPVRAGARTPVPDMQTGLTSRTRSKAPSPDRQVVAPRPN